MIAQTTTNSGESSYPFPAILSSPSASNTLNPLAWLRPGEANSIVGLLESFELALSVEAAVDYLAKVNDVLGKLYLYQQLFPQEYALSQAHPFPTEHEAYSERELEFFQLVDQKLFPVRWEMYEDENFNDCSRDPMIWITNLGCEWWDGDIEQLKDGWQMLLVLVGAVEPEVTKLEAAILSVLAEVKAGTLGWPELVWNCQHSPNPILAQLPTALEMIEHSTQNLWLDFDDENPDVGMEWCESDVLELAEQYKQASAMIQAVDEFIQWLEVESQSHLREVITLWNKATYPPSTSPSQEIVAQPPETVPLLRQRQLDELLQPTQLPTQPVRETPTAPMTE